MLQAAVITGRVVDEDGDPLPNFEVGLLRKLPGKSREPAVTRNDRTNDLGEYRLFGLAPGRYFVSAAYSSWRQSDAPTAEVHEEGELNREEDLQRVGCNDERQLTQEGELHGARCGRGRSTCRRERVK